MSLFPFDEKRKYQQELMDKVSDILQKQKHLIVHAPTGIGKTASVLIPALDFALKNNLTIFFLTSRHTQHRIIIETLEEIKKKHNKNIIVSDFVAKRWMCSQESVDELTNQDFLEFCKDLKKNNACPFYNNTKKETKKILKRVIGDSPIDHKELMRISEEHKVCPYEITCELGKISNVFVVDYLHLFEPSIRQSILSKTEKDLDKSIIIIDEAHNLPTRVRDMMSSRLTTFITSSALKEAEGIEEIRDIVNNIEIILEMLSSEAEKNEIEIDRQYLIDLLVQDCGLSLDEIILSLHTFGEEVRKTKKRSFCTSIAHFLENWKNKSEDYVRTLKKSTSKDGKYKRVELEMFSLDPSSLSLPMIMDSYSTIIMSGTLNPTYMYKQILGFPEPLTEIIEYPSPFPDENRLALIIPETSTKYEKRGTKQYGAIAKNCASVSKLVPGNLAIFFPSYFIRDMVYNQLQNMIDKPIILEEQDMTKNQKNELFEEFKSHSKEGAVLLAVSGASFSEGVDLPGDYLKGVMMVGIPLEHPDLKTKGLIDYYDKKFGSGWDYAYIVPAINRSLQAAGRCIRSETDKGTIIFMDERFAWPKYFKFLPKSWKFIITKNFSERIKDFFNQSQ